MTNEMRRDYLTDRWVILAPRRSKRPSDFAITRTRAQPKVCVFCRGNENLTPPATLLYIPTRNGVMKSSDVGPKRRSDWTVRCVPNLYPVVIPTRPRTKSYDRFPLLAQPALGIHEVIVESPRHDDHPHKASQKQTRLWLNAAIERINYLVECKAVESVVLFRNHGNEAGASIAHAHSQIITTPIIPRRIKEEHEALKRFRRATGNCALCQIRAHEVKGSRRILSLPNFTVIAPWASFVPFEFCIIPRRHLSSIVDLTRNEVEELANAVRVSFKALARLLSDPPYNLAFHLGPTKIHDDVYHWRIEVYPKLAIQAGFELGSGMYINTMKPETAAQALRENIS